MTRLLIIDDEPLILETLTLTFSDYDVLAVGTAQEAVAAFTERRPDAVLCDIRLPDESGLDLFRRLNQLDNKIPVILMTGQGSAGSAIEATRLGAFEYVLKPLDPDTLIPIVESAVETCRLMKVPAHLPSQADAGEGDLLIGRCPAMQEVYRSVGRVASQDVTVLILGESGTGKEVVARAIYHYSQRSANPFLAINCAAIPEQLLESELFGHEKGAFTGAERKRIGKFEQCSGGTIFLDEIGDMPPLMQTKILRVLQDQTFERVGGNETIHTDVRLIAATNRDLESMLEAREFRSDLFYRLNVYAIRLPPLRQRGDDIRLLANYFLKRFSSELRKPVTAFSDEVMRQFMTYAWPGNVRELQSVIKRALLEASGPVIVPAFLPDFAHKQTMGPSEQLADSSAPSALLDLPQLTRNLLASGSNDIHRELVGLAEQQIFAEVLKQTSGNLTQAARRLGITRTTLRAKLDGLGMSVERNATVEMP